MTQGFTIQLWLAGTRSVNQTGLALRNLPNSADLPRTEIKGIQHETSFLKVFNHFISKHLNDEKNVLSLLSKHREATSYCLFNAPEFK